MTTYIKDKETIMITKVALLKRKRIMYLAFSTLTLLFLGLIYAFSMFAAPMCSAFGLESSAVALTFNIMMIAFCIGAVLGSQIERAVGTRGAIIIAAIMFLGGFTSTGFFGQVGIGVVYGCYGVLGGLNVGIGYNSIIATTNAWFPDKVGFSSGVMLMGFGLGSLVLGTAAVNLIPLLGITLVFAGIGVATCIVTLLVAFVLSRPSDEFVAMLTPDKLSSGSLDTGNDDSPLKTPSFYVYWLWAAIVIAIGLATIGNCASDAQQVGIEAGFATLLVGLVSTCNGLARVVIGAIFDRSNVKVTMLVDGLAATFATLCIIGAFVSGVQILYIVGAFCCGFCYGGVPVVTSAFARQRFGSKNYPLNLSIGNFAIVFGALINIALQLTIGADARLSVFIVLSIMSLIALGVIAIFSRMWKADMRRLEEEQAAVSM